MPIIWKNNAPTCCDLVVTGSGYCMLCYQQYDPRALYDEFLVRKKEQMDAMRVVQPNVSSDRLAEDKGE